ncbi:MAG: phosphotransferase [Blastomonas sp.]
MHTPKSLDEVTADWLSEALAPRFPTGRIHHAEAVDIIHGACTKVRLAVRGDDPGLPPTMLMKAGFEPHSPAMRKMHVNEYHAYHDLMPTVGLNVPDCLCAAMDDEGNALVILEDLCLRDVRFLTLQQPIGFDLARGFLSGLARLHARWWNAPELDTQFGWVPDTTEESMEHYFNLLLTPEHFREYAGSPRGAAMPRMLLDPQRIRAAHAAMRDAHKRQARVVNHGDMHLGNLYVDADGTPGFLDSQPRLGAWSIDVSYFLIAALDLVDRRRWEGALLLHYLDSLKQHGIDPPSFDEAFAAYRRDVVWGLLIWMLNGSNFQTEANNTAAATRFAMAMIDLDCFGALGLQGGF